MLYYFVKIFAAFVRILPLRAALSLGGFLGYVTFCINPKMRNLAFYNLRLCFSKEKNFKEIYKITKNSFINAGHVGIEVCRLPLLNKKTLMEIVEVEKGEGMEWYFTNKKGVVILSMHYGSWELASVVSAVLGYRYKVLVNPQHRHMKLNDLLNEFRSCGGSITINRGYTSRDFIKSLKDDYAVALVADQGGKEGRNISFFGKNASMAVGGIRIALKYDMPLTFAVIHRVAPTKHKLSLLSKFDLVKTGDVESDIMVNLKKVVAVMEDHIRQGPEEYMWFYKIWKYSDQRKVAVLDDGKMGHLRQSQKIVKLIEKVGKEKRWEILPKEIKIIFQSKMKERLFKLASPLMRFRNIYARWKLLQWALTEESFDQLWKVPSDTVVSCGSSMGAVSFVAFYKQDNRCVHILKPNLLSYSDFSLVVLPQHDLDKKGKLSRDVISTYGALNVIDDEYLENQSRELLTKFPHLKNGGRLYLGVLIGGESKQVSMTHQQVKVLVHQLKEVAVQMNLDLLVTTSRRTPKNVDGMIEKELKDFDHCPLLILANRKNIPEAVGGILGLSRNLVVTGDSISMVSEALASRKQVTVVYPALKHGSNMKRSKHHRLIDQLQQEGYLLAVEAKGVGEAVIRMAKEKVAIRQLNQDDVLENALKRIL